MRRQESLLTERNDTGREGFFALVRRPAVQAVLMVAAVAQFAAAGRGTDDEGAAAKAAPRREIVATLAPALAAPTAEEDAATIELAAAMRADGYRVTDDLAEQITEAAEANDIDVGVAFGLVRAESSFRNVATSRVGAIGLTQLMPATARWLEPGITRSELRNPETNLRIGFRYLKDLIEKYDGDVDMALTAYNRGPGTVDRVLRRGGNPDNGYAAFVRTGKKGKHRG